MTDWIHPLLRVVHYALLLGLFGAAAFRLIGLRGLALESVDRRARIGLVAAAAAALVVSTALMLTMVAAMMGRTIGQLEWASIEAIVLETGIGWAFIARIILIASAIIVLHFAARSSLAGAAVLFGLALATLPWSGHAAVAEGALGQLHRASDTLHLLAAGLWIGAIGWFGQLIRAAGRDDHDGLAVPLLAVMHRFAPLGIALVGIVSATGFVNAYLIVGADSARWLGTEYGRLLALKIVLVGAMIATGARNAHVLRRGNSDAGERRAALRLLRANLHRELAFAVAVMGLVAFFGLMSPLPE